MYKACRNADVSDGPKGDERGRRQIAETGMRPHLVVVLPPRLDHDLGFCARSEPLQRQALVAELPVEALRRAILPGLARINQRRLDALPDDPFEQSTRDKFRAVVGPEAQRRAPLRHEPGEHLDHATRSNAASTSMASPSFVHSSVTVRHFSC